MIELRPYQNELADKAVDLLKNHGIAYMAMEVRTGKTITSLTAADRYLHGKGNVLFLTKKKAIGSIHADFIQLNCSITLSVVNYEQLDHVQGTFDLFILDEAHCLGQFPTPSERTKKLKKMIGYEPVIYLSGTPTPESWSQLFHQLWVSLRSPFAEYKSFYAWAKDYVTVKEKYFFNRKVNDYSIANKTKLDEKTSHLFISFSQSDAGFTEFVDEDIIYVTMDRRTYDLAQRLTSDRVVKSTMTPSVILADTEVKLMNKLHQIYSGTVICDEPERKPIVLDRSKALLIRDRFAGKKIAIFYKFIAELEILKEIFPNYTTSPEEFNTSTNVVFLSQVQSGREGINLSTADALVMYNIDFSAVSYWQSRARLQTKDRNKTAKVYWLFAKGGIEERVYRAVNNKKDYTLGYFKKDYLLKKVFI